MRILDKIIANCFNSWNKFFPTAGELSTSSFFIVIISGVALIIPFDISSPFQSLQILSLTNAGGVFFRNIHYWSAQIFFVTFLWHIFEHLFFCTEKEIANGMWIRLVLSIPFVLYLMLTGFILKGDSEAIMASQIFSGLIETLPFIGDEVEFALLGKENDFQIIYAHHIATFSIFIFVIIIEHTKRIWTDWLSIVYVCSICVIFSAIFPATLHNGLNQIIKGPWYFIGLQEILHWTVYPEYLLSGLLLILMLFYLLIKTSDKLSKRIKFVLLIMLFIYFSFSIVGWLFRGENWQFVFP